MFSCPSRCRFVVLPAMLWLATGCALVATRPVSDMVLMEAAFQAAKQAGAETQSPVFYQKASEEYRLAQSEYLVKNFYSARRHAHAAIRAAEDAEFDALKNSGASLFKPTSGS